MKSSCRCSFCKLLYKSSTLVTPIWTLVGLKDPFSNTEQSVLLTHFHTLGSTLSWKICEENTLECWKKQRKKRYLFCFRMFCLWFSFSSSSTRFSPLAAAEQPVGDGENEGGAREEEVLLGTRGTQRKGEEKGLRDNKEENIIHSCIIVNIIWLWYQRYTNYDQTTQI